MQYTVLEINNNIAKIEFSDGTSTFIELESSWTEADLDHHVYSVIPPHLKSGGGTPSFLSVGVTRTASENSGADEEPNPAWLNARIEAYGSVASQIEYITENGLEAWQAHVAQIKADNPSS